MQRAKTVDEYIQAAAKWQDELIRLRDILRDTGLVETVKWGAPCYTHNGKNVVGIGAFKSYYGLWFHQGALLRDKNNVLINAQEGVTKALRQWRMSSPKDIKPAVIKRYIKEAIAHADAGRTIKADRNRPIKIPRELSDAFQRDISVAHAFDKLRKSQQREYADYVSSAKRRDTRVSRLAKILPMIRSGVGLNDKYRS